MRSRSAPLLLLALSACAVGGAHSFSVPPSAASASAREASRVSRRWFFPSPVADLVSPPSRANKDAERDELAQKLLAAAKKAGQVGVKASEESNAAVRSAADALAKLSDRNPARAELDGVHDLVYSAAPGGSSGAVGPLVGKVTQTFPDDTKFINAVRLGPVTIKLHAEREILDGSRIRVKFRETSVEILGAEVVRKEAKGAGVWKQLFVGRVKGEDGRTRLLRVMETPSLFVIEQVER